MAAAAPSEDGVFYYVPERPWAMATAAPSQDGVYYVPERPPTPQTVLDAGSVFDTDFDTDTLDALRGISDRLDDTDRHMRILRHQTRRGFFASLLHVVDVFLLDALLYRLELHHRT